MSIRTRSVFDCRGSADYKANIDNIDDLSFLKAIEEYIAKQLDQSFDYRFATGHSNGGHFCFKLALESPEWITAIAPISANLPIDGGGHTIPHTKSKMPKILGVTNQDINAGAEIWHFFKQQIR